MATKWVYMFKEGNATMRNLLGGKGANLAEMTGLGLPVPQGFVVRSILIHFVHKNKCGDLVPLKQFP